MTLEDESMAARGGRKAHKRAFSRDGASARACGYSLRDALHAM